MTTIAVARKHGVAAIGADTMSTFAGTKLTPRLVRNHQKLVPCGEAVLAFTGSGPWGEILAEFLAEEENRVSFASAAELFRWSQRLFEAARLEYRLAADDSDTEPFENSHVQLLVASSSGVFGLHQDRSVDEYERFFAFGSGSLYALGAMCAVYESAASAEEVVRTGLRCAGELQVYTGDAGEVRLVQLREQRHAEPDAAPDPRRKAGGAGELDRSAAEGARMAKAVRMVRDDAYEEMGAAYQCVLVAALDAALREHGVKSAATRRKVAESFLFAVGEFHDTGWLRPSDGAEAVYPVLCFAERFLNLDTAPAALGTVYAPSPGFAFHEYAHGSAGAFYDGDPAAQVETGSVGAEE